MSAEQWEKNLRYDRLSLVVMRRVLKRHSNCVDVGCLEGAILRHMVTLAPRGIHFAFEPLPEHAERLRKEFPSVRIMEMALSDESGNASFRHVLDVPGFSGFERRPYDTYEERVEMISVDVGRLDDVIPEDVPIRLIKVDVEGAEARVFRGAANLLRRQRPYVLFEMGLYPEQVHDALVEDAGLHISLLEDWLARREPLDRSRFLDQTLGAKNWFFLAHP